MSTKVFDFCGENDFYRKSYMGSKRSDQTLSLGLESLDVDVLFPLFKRSRVCAPFVFSNESSVPKQPSIEVLPDECLFEIFRRLSGDEEKSSCACVSKRWLMLVSSIRASETCHQKTPEAPSCTEGKSPRMINHFVSEWNKKVDEFNNVDGGYLARYLEGKEATDVRLAAIGVGSRSRGGLGMLSIHGSIYARGVTDSGLKAIAYGCPSLRYLSLWQLPLIGDEGLVEIAKGCPLLETLNLSHCHGISDKALQAIAKHCSSLTSLTIESCSNIGNEGLVAVANCPNLKSVTIKNCKNIGDQGIGRLFTLAGNVLEKVTLESLNITDVSVAVMGRYGSSLTDLVLSGLNHVNERGFWVMGNCMGLVNLCSFAVNACPGMTDIALVAVVKGSPFLKRACLRKCAFVSDMGLVSFVKAVRLLESLHLDECHKVTQVGVFGILANRGSTLKTLALANCFGIKDMVCGAMLISPCHSLQSLSVRNCPGFGNACLSALASVCPNISNIELISLNGISDMGILLLVKSSDAGLVKVKLSGCVNVTDNVVSAIAKLHGGMLEVLELDGCQNITDASLFTLTEYCWVLRELDVSYSKITDAGIIALANGTALDNLHTLSLAGCSLLSDAVFPALEILGEFLTGLNIKHCNGISSDLVDLFVDEMWNCHILS